MPIDIDLKYKSFLFFIIHFSILFGVVCQHSFIGYLNIMFRNLRRILLQMFVKIFSKAMPESYLQKKLDTVTFFVMKQNISLLIAIFYLTTLR